MSGLLEPLVTDGRIVQIATINGFFLNVFLQRRTKILFFIGNYTETYLVHKKREPCLIIQHYSMKIIIVCNIKYNRDHSRSSVVVSVQFMISSSHVACDRAVRSLWRNMDLLSINTSDVDRTR